MECHRAGLADFSNERQFHAHQGSEVQEILFQCGEDDDKVPVLSQLSVVIQKTTAKLSWIVGKLVCFH
jgi:hypothetical protein